MSSEARGDDAGSEGKAVVVSSSGSAQSSVAGGVEAKPKRTWRSSIWDTLDKPPEERRFLFKLDAVVLTMGSLGYFLKLLGKNPTLSCF